MSGSGRFLETLLDLVNARLQADAARKAIESEVTFPKQPLKRESK